MQVNEEQFKKVILESKLVSNGDLDLAIEKSKKMTRSLEKFYFPKGKYPKLI